MGVALNESAGDLAARAQRRYRSAAYGTFANFTAKVAQGSLAILTVPLAITAFGPERYGIWMMVSSMLPMLGLVDQGFSFGLVQGLAEANGRDDRSLAARQVATYFFGSVAVALLGGIAVAIGYVVVPWGAILGVAPAFGRETSQTMAAVGALFLANLLAGLVQKIHSGYQEQAANSAWQVVGSAFSLAGILLVVRGGGTLPWLAVAVMGGPVAAAVLAWGMMLKFRPYLRPAWAQFDSTIARRGGHSASIIVASGCLMSALTASDNFVIAHAFSSREVTAYSVPWRLYSVVLNIAAMMPLALWPAAREALARGEYAWVRQSLRRVLVVAAGGSIVSGVALVVWGSEIVAWWSRGAVRPSFELLVALSLWLVAATASSIVQTYLGALDQLRWQFAMTAILTVLVVGAKVVVIPKTGAVLAPLLTATGLLLLIVVPGLRRIRLELSRREAARG